MGITSLRAWIVAASLLSICAVSHAAGLGKLNVTSALGEPLKAEIDLVAEKNEIGSLAARLASPDAFERAGLAYSSLMNNVKVSIEKRSGGEPYVRLTSTQPVTEPFVDLLIELTWSSGRISREFTALLDPPSVIAEREKQKAAAAEVRAAPPPPQPKAEPVPEPVAEVPVAETAKPETAKTEEPAAQAPAEAAATEPAPAEPIPAPAPVPTAPVETFGGTQPTLLNAGGSALPSGAASAPAADAYGPVRSGDTLGKIASATKPADVSLEQMLVLLVRNNPDAFSGKNMNRLKTGKILQLPTADQLAGISEADARKEVKVQARDWRAYREQLAAAAGQAVPAEQPAQQAVSGKVGAAAEDQAASAKERPKEVLKLSKNEPAADCRRGCGRRRQRCCACSRTGRRSRCSRQGGQGIQRPRCHAGKAGQRSAGAAGNEEQGHGGSAKACRRTTGHNAPGARCSAGRGSSEARHGNGTGARSDPGDARRAAARNASDSRSQERGSCALTTGTGATEAGPRQTNPCAQPAGSGHGSAGLSRCGHRCADHYRRPRGARRQAPA